MTPCETMARAWNPPERTEPNQLDKGTIVMMRQYVALVLVPVLLGAGACLLLVRFGADEPWLFSRHTVPEDVPGGRAIMGFAAVVLTVCLGVVVKLREAPLRRVSIRADRHPVAFAATLLLQAFTATRLAISAV